MIIAALLAPSAGISSDSLTCDGKAMVPALSMFCTKVSACTFAELSRTTLVPEALRTLPPAWYKNTASRASDGSVMSPNRPCVVSFLATAASCVQFCGYSADVSPAAFQSALLMYSERVELSLGAQYSFPL